MAIFLSVESSSEICKEKWYCFLLKAANLLRRFKLTSVCRTFQVKFNVSLHISKNWTSMAAINFSLMVKTQHILVSCVKASIFFSLSDFKQHFDGYYRCNCKILLLSFASLWFGVNSPNWYSPNISNDSDFCGIQLLENQSHINLLSESPFSNDQRHPDFLI